MEEDVVFGLAGLGQKGRWTVEVLEGTASCWALSIHASARCFDFELAGLGAVRALSEFLCAHDGRTSFAELAVGSFHGAVVRVIKDDEFADRFFLRTERIGISWVDFTLVGEDAQAFIDAVGEAVEDLGQDA